MWLPGIIFPDARSALMGLNRGFTGHRPLVIFTHEVFSPTRFLAPLHQTALAVMAIALLPNHHCSAS